MKEFKMHTFLTCLAFAFLTTSVIAEMQPDTLSVGAGIMVKPRYAGSSGVKIVPIPMLNASYSLAESQRLYWQGLEAGYAYQATENFEIGLAAGIDMGRDTQDDDKLYGLAEVDKTLELGPVLTYKWNENWKLQAQTKTDITGNGHNGSVARAKVGYSTMLGRGFILGANAGVTMASADYMESYFDVPASAARADRPSYDANAGLHSLNLGANMVYPVAGKWSVLANVGADYLVGDAADSPLVQQNLQPRVLVGLSYRFF
jgi:outer membrane scaffolding protein for murein synthesis (MipA/OmpV family)